MNYEELSYFEINKRVAVALGHELMQCSITNIGLQTVIKESVGNDWVPAKIPDYCNNPSDAWPIIIENKISLYAGQTCLARHEEYDSLRNDFYHDDANPLRAAMIVYLMMQDKD